MGIVFARTPPDAATDVLSRALSDLAPSDRSPSSIGGRGPLPRDDGRSLLAGGEVDVSRAIPIYRLLPRAFETTEPLAEVEFAGWRYIVMHQHSIGFADLAEPAEHHLLFSRLVRNEYASLFLKAARLAHDLAASTLEAGELRALEIPYLHTSALWLTFKRPIFIPYIMPRRPSAEVPYIDPEFLEELNRQARSARLRRTTSGRDGRLKQQ